MRGLNKVTLIGNPGKDPEINVLDGNVPVVKFSLATTETWRDKAGQPHTSTDWHSVVLWRGLAPELIRSGFIASVCASSPRPFSEKEKGGLALVLV